MQIEAIRYYNFRWYESEKEEKLRLMSTKEQLESTSIAYSGEMIGNRQDNTKDLEWVGLQIDGSFPKKKSEDRI